MTLIRTALLALACGTHFVTGVFAAEPAPKRVAAIVTEYRTNSHADVICSRLLQTQTLDGKGEKLGMTLVSLYVDQKPESDLSAKFAKEYGFTVYDTVEGALTLGTGKLAVDGVILVAEHGSYPMSETEQVIYPKRRLFEQIAKVFRDSGNSTPVFSDKHLADNWTDAKWFYDTARELKAPLMAGSSISMTWRVPEANVKKGAKLKQVVAVGYGGLDAYGFHTFEMLQCLAERRAGGETGVKSVQCYSDEAVWKGFDEGIYDRELLMAALSRMEVWPLKKDKTLQEQVPHPVAFVVDYADGCRGVVFMLNGAVADFVAAWKYDDGKSESTLFKLDEDRPFMHFANQTAGIDRLMHEGKAPWPVERTLLTSGLLDAGLTSRLRKGELLKTDYLMVPYQVEWEWKSPPPSPVKR